MQRKQISCLKDFEAHFFLVSFLNVIESLLLLFLFLLLLLLTLLLFVCLFSCIYLHGLIVHHRSTAGCHASPWSTTAAHGGTDSERGEQSVAVVCQFLSRCSRRRGFRGSLRQLVGDGEHHEKHCKS